ncbi:hypothetical protein [Alkaliphilus hydrothermalis]|uniref:Regulatory protein YycH of two-component signal transduction system YycFG n=1 Tax=Alkaliphilus hydrothermalis TaxID=1482730 RepID=A0ABS2NRI8_9FIRM|nr:hypothetical protein [Alkaliphilus hydrothermalis]MBM7615541.1 regulatory protein YycH of two-component signal transduction system YycFG [Alkaliphilus hydrothermalis]
MDRERTKTLILSLLVILSIMSLHRIWFDSPISLQSEASNGRDQGYTILDTRNQIISPREVTLGFGGSISNNYYTVLNYQETKLVWEKSKLLLLDFFAKEPNVDTVSLDEYFESKQLKSIELEFGKGMPSVLISSVFNTMDNRITNEIRTIKKILIPASNTGSIYILSENENNVYRVSLSEYENTTLEDYITEYDEDKKDFVRYRTTFGFVNNKTLMPIEYKQLLPEIFVESEIDIKEEEIIVRTAKSFFNENFDFVKAIRETSGSIIYLYGYGEKSVRINPQGYLSYNQEMISNSSTNILEALNVALNFIEKHGGIMETAYLSEIKDVSTGSNRGYYFGFNYDIVGYPIANKNTLNQLEIEVYGNDVKSYRRFIREKMNLGSIDHIDTDITPPIQIIEDNLGVMLDYYNKDLENSKTMESTNAKNEPVIDYKIILENVNRVEMVYFDTVEENSMQLIRPSWLIRVGKRIYYFDSYDGKLLYTMIEN